MQVRGDVEPRREAEIVEDFQAALVAHGRDQLSVVLEAVAIPQVVIPYAEDIVLAARDRAAAGNAKNGRPFDRVWLA